MKLFPGALGIALMSFTETIAAGRAFATNEEPHLRPTRSWRRLDLRMRAARSWAPCRRAGHLADRGDRLAGARTQLAALVTAGAALLDDVLPSRLSIGLMSQATLAAMVIVYSIGFIKPSDFRLILEIRRTEFLWALPALAGVVLLGTSQGILVAIVASLATLAHRTAHPRLRALGRKLGTNVFRALLEGAPEDETFPVSSMIQLEGQVFFADVEPIGEKMRALADEAKPRVVVLDSAGCPISTTPLSRC